MRLSLYDLCTLEVLLKKPLKLFLVVPKAIALGRGT
jgi:hypothetical protein